MSDIVASLVEIEHVAARVVEVDHFVNNNLPVAGGKGDPGSPGTTDHAVLENRNAPGAHTPEAVGADPAGTAAELVAAETAARQQAITTAINGLINGAPGALDQLNELAAAMGNDVNFAATVVNALAGKEPTLTTMTQAQAEDAVSGVAVKTTGQRIWQAIAKWAGTATSTFLGIFSGTAKNYTETEYDIPTTSGAVTLDLANGNVQRVALTGALTITLPALPAAGKSASLVLRIVGNGTAAVSWGAAPVIDWLTSDNAAPPLNVGAGKTSVVPFISSTPTTSWLGFFAGKVA